MTASSSESGSQSSGSGRTVDFATNPEGPSGDQPERTSSAAWVIENPPKHATNSTAHPEPHEHDQRSSSTTSRSPQRAQMPTNPVASRRGETPTASASSTSRAPSPMPPPSCNRPFAWFYLA